MIKIDIPILVEGKYDKIKLSSFIEGNIIVTDGFGVFNNEEKIKMIKRLGQKAGVLILTDSDSGGFIIRNYLKGRMDGVKVYNAYIPEILGKEKRKTTGGKEGLLGVEGVKGEIILKAIEKSGALGAKNNKAQEIKRGQLYDDGLIGGENSKERRAALLKACDLPNKIGTNELLKVLNSLFTLEEYKEILTKI